MAGLIESAQHGARMTEERLLLPGASGWDKPSEKGDANDSTTREIQMRQVSFSGRKSIKTIKHHKFE